MKSLLTLSILLLAALVSSECHAQCRGGGGSPGGASGGSLLTSPGSWGYQLVAAQAYRQHVAQQQYAYSMAKAAERAKKLEYRRVRAAASRQQLAERREDIRRQEQQRRSESRYQTPQFATSRQ